MTKIPSVRWNMAGIAFRFWAAASIIAFQFTFFAYFQKPYIFSYASLGILLTGGVASNLLASVLSERLTCKTQRAKSLVAASMCLFAAIFSYLMLVSQTFGAAIAFYFVYFTLSDGLVAPVLSMLSIAAPANAKGQVMGYFVTIVSLVGIFVPLVIAAMFPSPVAPLMPENHSVISKALIYNTVPFNVAAAICFLVGGGYYAEEFQKQEEVKIDNLASAISQLPELNGPNDLIKTDLFIKASLRLTTNALTTRQTYIQLNASNPEKL